MPLGRLCSIVVARGARSAIETPPSNSMMCGVLHIGSRRATTIVADLCSAKLQVAWAVDRQLCSSSTHRVPTQSLACPDVMGGRAALAQTDMGSPIPNYVDFLGSEGRPPVGPRYSSGRIFRIPPLRAQGRFGPPLQGRGCLVNCVRTLLALNSHGSVARRGGCLAAWPKGSGTLAVARS